MAEFGGKITVTMPTQTVSLLYGCTEPRPYNLVITITYTHPTTNDLRTVQRQPSKHSFSQKHFEKEMEAYVVQEAMSDLMDNRHSYDWIE